jgi:hypothetical protein
MDVDHSRIVIEARRTGVGLDRGGGQGRRGHIHAPTKRGAHDGTNQEDGQKPGGAQPGIEQTQGG